MKILLSLRDFYKDILLVYNAGVGSVKVIHWLGLNMLDLLKCWMIGHNQLCTIEEVIHEL